MGIAKYIREIGRGKEGARALSREQAHDLLAQLLDGKLTDLEIGAFALAMRIKGETAAELAGFLDAVHTRCIALPAPPRPALLLPSYNGARRLPVLTPLLARLLAQRGVPVLVHGPLRDPGRVASAEVFEALGWPLARDADALAAAWRGGAPAFMPIDSLCPPLARLLEVRRTVGLRNSGHTVAKLLAPLPGLRVMNHTHPEYGVLLREFVALTGADALLLRGTEGEPVADPRRQPAFAVFIGGRERAELSRPAQDGALGELPALPREIDATSTARYIGDLLADPQAVPRPLQLQVQVLLAALDAAANG